MRRADVRRLEALREESRNADWSLDGIKEFNLGPEPKFEHTEFPGRQEARLE